MVNAAVIVLAILGAKLLAQLWLDRLNEAEVRRHSGAVPDAFREVIDEAAYQKAVRYTLAKSRFGKWLYKVKVKLKLENM